MKKHDKDDGILIIREGVTDFKDKQRNTVFTEYLSTKIFNFNKKENDFYFFHSSFIQKFAKENNMIVDLTENHSKSTSNMLFILRKN